LFGSPCAGHVPVTLASKASCTVCYPATALRQQSLVAPGKLEHLPYISIVFEVSGPYHRLLPQAEISFRNQTRTGRRAVMATGSSCKCPQSPLLSPASAWADKTGLPNIFLALALVWNRSLDSGQLQTLSSMPCQPCAGSWGSSRVWCSSKSAQNSQHSTFASFSVGRC